MATIQMKLKDKAKTLPDSPGCYLMKNSQDHIIYVGKAKSLKKRVGSYFSEAVKNPKTTILVSHIRDFDFMITGNETEAFILENNLIKKHKPKYNIRLKDDKSFPYVVIDHNHAFPRLEYLRKPKRKDNTTYFGPFSNAGAVSEAMKTIVKLLRLRDCTDYDFSTRKKPCLLYQMNQCTAPCVDYIDEKSYRLDLEKAVHFFEGIEKAKPVLKYLEKEMERSAESEQFERAALIRDGLEVLSRYLEQSTVQNVENIKEKELDVFSFYQAEHEVDISLYMIRGGSLLAHKNFHFFVSDFIESLPEEILKTIFSYYEQSKDMIPGMIAIDMKAADLKSFIDAMKEHFKDFKFKIVGRKKELLPIYRSVAEHAEEVGRVRTQNQGSFYEGLTKLQNLLKLKERPIKLECYDIAIWQGKSPTASRIVFINGRPDKKLYRYYHLTELPEKNNDFKMLKEVIDRRVGRGDLPDVFIIDGGVGQVNSVLSILREHNINIPVVGIAKARTEKDTEERLIIPGRKDPYILKKSPELMKIIVKMRDEAHRFSRKLHHKAELSRVTHSILDEVKGIGPKAKERILNNKYFDVKIIKKMSIREIQDTFNLNAKQAESLFDYFK